MLRSNWSFGRSFGRAARAANLAAFLGGHLRATVPAVCERRPAAAVRVALRCMLMSLALAGVHFGGSPARADINDIRTGQPLPGTQGITLGPGLTLSDWNYPPGWPFPGYNLQYGDFSNNGAGGVNLTGASFTRMLARQR